MASSNPTIELTNPVDGTATLRLAGRWSLANGRPKVKEVVREIDRLPAKSKLLIDTSATDGYDSSLTALLLRIARTADERGINLDYDSHTDAGIKKLLGLALSVPISKDTERHHETERDFFSQVGEATIELYDNLLDSVTFVGEAILSMFRLIAGKARFRKADLWLNIQTCGAEALPIVTLISFLIGTILAFVGKAQLDTFGASIYVADLVGIAMVREMGCVMTGIIMSGRTGAAFAAQIGSMKVTQEVDALRTFGFKPFDYLVLPRMLALVMMMPILTIYANMVGIVGGLLVSWSSGIAPMLYINQTIERLDLLQLSLGVFKSVFFGIVIAGAGCLRGLQSGNSSSAVGTAATRAVVTSITLIIIIDSFFAVLFTIFNI